MLLNYDLAETINKEILALVDAGCSFIQVDEPLFARQVDDAIAIEDATEVISENAEESTTTIQPTTTTTTEPATLENGCPVGSRSRGGRLIMAERKLTRTFTSISLGSVLVLSTGTSKTFYSVARKPILEPVFQVDNRHL